MSAPNPQDVAAQQPASEPPTPSVAVRSGTLLSRLVLLAKYVLPLAGLFFLGWLVNRWSGSFAGAPAGKDEPNPAAAQLARPPSPNPQGEKPDAAIGDAHLRDGNFAQALPHFLPAEPDSRSSLPDTILFRAALCLEGLGRWKEALAVYREAVARTSNGRMVAASQVAQARVWMRHNQTPEAKSLLYAVLLQAGQRGTVDPSLTAEARFLLSMALSQDAFADQRLAGSEEALVRVSSASWPLLHSLGWIAAAGDVKGDAKKLPYVLEIGQKIGDKDDDVLIRGQTPAKPVAVHVEHLAALAKWRVQWSKQAVTRVQERSARVAVEAMPLMDVIRALVEPLGLVCQCKAGVLHVFVETEMAIDMLAHMRVEAARRSLRSAFFADPEHPLAALACLELGNNEAAAGRFEEAVAWFDRLLVDGGRPPFASAAAFNLGLVQRALKEYAAARMAFYGVVDRAPGHELVCRAFMQVGWTYLLDGQVAEAVPPLRKALQGAPPAALHAEAAITLAAALLLNGSAPEANAVLVAHRADVKTEPWRTTAAFVDALARFRAAGMAKQARLESGDLVAALLAFQKRPTLGGIGKLLLGQAYKELGMPREMAKIFEQALPAVHAAVADEMTFELADHWQTEGQLQPARKLFQKLALSAHGKWGPAARLRLAALALQEGNPKQCLLACTALLQQDAASIQRTAVLRLMGQAYEQLGDYQMAARCYRGEVPE